MVNLIEFLPPGQDLSVAYLSTYDVPLVSLSVLMAVFASFMALELSGRIVHASTTIGKIAWLVPGSVAMGGGVWAMHFIGMLAFSLPCGIYYDPMQTLVSMVPGVAASAVALWIISRADISFAKLGLGGVLMGGGIGTMHYSGMAAMRLDAVIYYSPTVFALSVGFAVALAILSLQVKFALQHHQNQFPRWAQSLAAAAVMGIAISGMHYIAMEAAYFIPIGDSAGTVSGISPTVLAAGIGITTAMLVAMVLAGSILGRHLETINVLKREVHERKQAEKALRASEARLSLHIQNTPVGAVSWDKKFHCTEWNKAAEKIFGYTAEEAIGQHAAGIVVPAKLRDDINKIFALLLEQQGGTRSTNENITKNGKTITCDWYNTPILSLNGEVVGVSSLVQDITSRKQAEESLLIAKDEAEKANMAKSEFLASMSHELRTPLNAVLGFAQMLQFDPKTSLTPAQNEHVESILAGGNHLLELVNEVLDLAKIEANQLDLSLEEVSANDVVAECVAMAIPLGEPQDITIIDQFSGGSLSLLRTDQLRFKQCLLNLLSNAVKFNRDGGTVTVDGRETEDGFLHISVKDTGIGIAEQHRTNIFHMFHRLGVDPMVAQEGTGIGLTVTKLLVEQMAGQVGFESEDGVGSTFWIKLPLASNEDVLIWTHTMRVGIDAIDKDHQFIISLLNRVTHGLASDGVVEEVIMELVDYTHYHFRREETIMEVCGDPNLEKHRDHHQRLAAQLSELANNWRKNPDPDFIHRIREFLRDWVFNHVIPDDIGISQYAIGKDQEIRRALENLE